jgi:hypothetical protein
MPNVKVNGASRQKNNGIIFSISPGRRLFIDGVYAIWKMVLA